jgi:hypothetical protein
MDINAGNIILINGVIGVISIKNVIRIKAVVSIAINVTVFGITNVVHVHRFMLWTALYRIA